MRRPTIGSAQLLVTYVQAAEVLAVTVPRLRELIDAGHLTPHPILADRIDRPQIERFALHYGHENAEADTSSRRAMDAQSAHDTWDVPSLRVRPLAR